MPSTGLAVGDVVKMMGEPLPKGFESIESTGSEIVTESHAQDAWGMKGVRCSRLVL